MSNKAGVVYTCIIGKYDELKNHSFTNPNWDYVCFTDDLDIKNVTNSLWEIRPLAFDKLDDVRNQRWHKLHPHYLLPEYQNSLYIDGHINIVNENIFKDIENIDKLGSAMSLGPHFSRKNIFDEFDACTSLGKDNPNIIKKQRELIEKTAFSGEYGTFFENGIIYRKHNDPKVISIMKDWWWWIENYSRRDQLSLAFVLWKNDFNVLPLTGASYRNNIGIQFTNNENHVTKEELIVLKNKLQQEVEKKNITIQLKELEIQQNEQSLRQSERELKNKEKELNSLNLVIINKDFEISCKNKKIIQKKQELDLVKSSKFWKVRDRYLKMKYLILKK